MEKRHRIMKIGMVGQGYVGTAVKTVKVELLLKKKLDKSCEFGIIKM